MPMSNSTSQRLVVGSLLAVALTACQTTPTHTPPATGPAGLATEYNSHAPKPNHPNPQTAPPATNPSNAVNSAEMLAALRQLSAEDYQTRQDAVQKLQLAMTRHFQQLVQMQELMLKIQDNLAAQLQDIRQTPAPDKDPRAASLMEFNQALSRWAIDTLSQPADRREALLQWG